MKSTPKNGRSRRLYPECKAFESQERAQEMCLGERRVINNLKARNSDPSETQLKQRGGAGETVPEGFGGGAGRSAGDVPSSGNGSPWGEAPGKNKKNLPQTCFSDGQKKRIDTGHQDKRGYSRG